ncbi:MAG: hypothetical protein A2174_00310 [Candidatus Portnoybacteria bacterium RBG_13_41_18]|uniref:DUF5667 domain-containing protein n=1 Tax=Candidatus Portnoybacteria bacterium RBG_13_41_18 TaxID=1801991 RepID=A0A1G2FA08_9BACT|nr:MAG: hypothetical protein A2174_00310 [Candidatus Portnoybacteria bacterium RBG_13_41_18]
MKKIIFVVVLLVFVFSAAAAHMAVYNSASTTIRQQIKQNREELKIRIESNASSTMQVIALKREEIKSQIEANKEQLKEKLKFLKDERKKQIIERINDQLAKLNDLMVDHFLAVLARLEKVLNNVGSRADKAEAAGKDVAVVRAAITNAQQLINTSRETVKAQAGKIYNVAISGEEAKLKPEVGEARQALHADLVAVRKTVQAARDAVHNVATTLAQIPKVDDLEEESDVDADNNNSTSTDDTSVYSD